MHAGTAQLTDAGWITQTGHQELSAELEHLRTVEQPAARERVRIARLDGGLADNPGLMDVMEHQARIEHRMAFLGERLANARVQTEVSTERAEIGTHVVVLDVEARITMDFVLVGHYEADPEQGRVSIDSPIGAAVHQLTIGAVGIAETPRGPRRMQLLEVSLA